MIWNGNVLMQKKLIRKIIEKMASYLCNYKCDKKYNPQIEMFARFKTKSSFHKTKRII